MSLIKKLKDKISYERESYRMASESLEQSAWDHPFPPFFQSIRMTEAELIEWRKQLKAQKRGRK